MEMTRKRFLRALGTGLAAATAFPRLLLGAGGGGLLADWHDPAVLARQIGSVFATLPSDSTPSVALTLTAVSTLKGDPATSQFSASFVSASGDPLPPKLNTFTHPHLGLFQLFLVPSGPDADGNPTYRADFCLLRKR